MPPAQKGTTTDAMVCSALYVLIKNSTLTDADKAAVHTWIHGIDPAYPLTSDPSLPTDGA